MKYDAEQVSTVDGRTLTFPSLIYAQYPWTSTNANELFAREIPGFS